MPRRKKVLRMTDVAYWVAKGFSRIEAQHRAMFTARGTRRKSKQQRATIHRQVWRDAWESGERIKAKKKKLLSPAQRSAVAVAAWETRRKNQKKAEAAHARKVAKLRRERRERRHATVIQIGV